MNPANRLILSAVFLLAGIVYWISPVDLLPDVFPPVTYIDDLGVLLTAFVNALYSYIKYKRSSAYGKLKKK